MLPTKPASSTTSSCFGFFEGKLDEDEISGTVAPPPPRPRLRLVCTLTVGKDDDAGGGAAEGLSAWAVLLLSPPTKSGLTHACERLT